MILDPDDSETKVKYANPHEQSFVTLSEAYSKSYDSQKPQLLDEIDKVLDNYLSFTASKDTPIIYSTHEGSDEKDS